MKNTKDKHALECGVVRSSIYTFECYDKFGNLKWREEIPNLVTTEGLNDSLDKHLKGSGYTAAWYCGLIDNASFSSIQAGDTAAKITDTVNAPTTNAWQEADDYDEAARQEVVFGDVAAGSVDNSASKAVFTISGTVTIKGAFLSSASAKNATTGVLYGAAAFSTERALVDDDVLNVTVTCTAAAA